MASLTADQRAQIKGLALDGWPQKDIAVAFGCSKTHVSKIKSGHHNTDPDPDYQEEDRGYATPCWIWQRCYYGKYGALNRDGMHSAHRWYYVRAKGPIPEGFHVDHLCRVTGCVNPDHLEAVTHKENVRRGKSTKLSMEALSEIIKRYFAGESAAALGKEFDYSPNAILLVARGAEVVMSWES